VNGPYALITTAVSAELGSHSSVSPGSNAMATVTAIIDGTGSVGAALGPLFAGLLKDVGSNWIGVFIMVMLSDFFALLLLLRIAIKEVIRLRRRKDPADTL
ncbi:sugar phosphate exchanger 2-like, partial [Tropilaelaps mercedesae]